MNPSKYQKKRNNYISYAMVVTHIVVVLSPIYISAYLGPGLISILIYLYIGIAFNSTLNLMHEACHSHVFTSKRPNQILGQWILGPLFFSDFESYKLRHWDHHKFLGKDGETKFTYFIDIKGSNFLIFIIKGMLMIELIYKIKNLFKVSSRVKKKEQSIFPVLRILVFQSFLLISLFIVAFLAANGEGVDFFFNS